MLLMTKTKKQATPERAKTVASIVQAESDARRAEYFRLLNAPDSDAVKILDAGRKAGRTDAQTAIDAAAVAECRALADSLEMHKKLFDLDELQKNTRRLTDLAKEAQDAANEARRKMNEASGIRMGAGQERANLTLLLRSAIEKSNGMFKPQ